MISLMWLGTALAEEPVWPVRPPPPPPPKTLQDYVDRSQLVLHVRVDRLEPYDASNIEPFTATEVHMVVIEALKGSAPENDVWFGFPDRFAANFRLASTVGSELLIFAVSTANSHGSSAHGVDMPDAGTLIRVGSEGVTLGDGSVPHWVGPEPTLTWTDLLVRTRAAVARSTANNAIVVGPERP